MFDTTTTRDISKFFVSKFRIITYNSFEISLVVFLPNITTNYDITYTNLIKNATWAEIVVAIA